MTGTYDREFMIAEAAARQAGKIILDKQGSAGFSEKADHNLVTEADFAAQDAIIEMIRQNYPHHDFIAEENDYAAGKDSPDLWIIDPLDGTNNFAHAIPHFSISIAYARRGRVVVGIVLDPVRNEMFSAVSGKGASLNGNPIRVSEARSLQEAVIATGFYYDRGAMMRKTLDSIKKLFEANIHGVRRFGSAALDLCWVACGRFDAYFEYKLSTWDFAAGMLIVDEAGGCCTDQAGKPLDLYSKGIAVSNGRFHEDFIKVVGWNE